MDRLIIETNKYTGHSVICLGRYLTYHLEYRTITGLCFAGFLQIPHFFLNHICLPIGSTPLPGFFLLVLALQSPAIVVWAKNESIRGFH